MQVILQGQTTPDGGLFYYPGGGRFNANWDAATHMLWLPDFKIPDGFTKFWCLQDGRYTYPTEGFYLSPPGLTTTLVFGGHSFTRYRGCLATTKVTFNPNQYGQSYVGLGRLLLTKT